jgi:acyl-homoserine-lactone acylase
MMGEHRFEAEIRRTSYGVAHIRSSTWGGIGFGQGYACAQDNVALIVDQIAKVRGTRARLFGRGPAGAHVNSDFAYEVLGLRSAAPAALAAQPDEIRELVEGYAAGVNAWMSSPAALPLPDWCSPAAAIAPIEAADIFAYLSDLTLAAGARNFVPFIAGARPPGPEGPAPAPPLRMKGAGYGSSGWAIGRARTESGSGMVMANPHFPWYGEVRLWECHLTLPGELDVYGVTLVGSPGVQMGFNRDIAWSHTFSAGNRFTLYRHELVPGCPTSYRYGDATRDMVERRVGIEVLGEDGEIEHEERSLWSTHHGAVLNMPIFGWSDQWAFSFRDANDGNDRFLAQFLGMNRSRSLDQFQAVFREENGIPWVNTLASDTSGRTWYIDASRTPNLGAGGEAWFRSRLDSDPLTRLLFDNKVALLDGSDPACEWADEAGAPAPGLLPFAGLPQIERDDWVTNSNESHWLTNPAAPLEGFSALFGREHHGPKFRTRANLHALSTPGSGPQGRLTKSDVIERVLSNRSVAAMTLCTEIVARCRAAGSAVIGNHEVDISRAAEILERWDRCFDLASRGAALWRETMASFPEDALATAGTLFADTFDPLAPPFGGPSRLVPPPQSGSDPVVLAVAKAILALESASIDLDAPLSASQWVMRGDERIPVHGGQEVDGVINVLESEGTLPTTSMEPAPEPSAPVEGRTERTGLRQGGYAATYGTTLLMVVDMAPDGPTAEGFLSYGQSADPRSPHYADQVGLYVAKRLRPMLFEEAAITADENLVIETVRG